MSHNIQQEQKITGFQEAQKHSLRSCCNSKLECSVSSCKEIYGLYKWGFNISHSTQTQTHTLYIYIYIYSTSMRQTVTLKLKVFLIMIHAQL
jgi:hypothetical protein